MDGPITVAIVFRKADTSLASKQLHTFNWWFNADASEPVGQRAAIAVRPNAGKSASASQQLHGIVIQKADWQLGFDG